MLPITFGCLMLACYCFVRLDVLYLMSHLSHGPYSKSNLMSQFDAAAIHMERSFTRKPTSLPRVVVDGHRRKAQCPSVAQHKFSVTEHLRP